MSVAPVAVKHRVPNVMAKLSARSKALEGSFLSMPDRLRKPSLSHYTSD